MGKRKESSGRIGLFGPAIGLTVTLVLLASLLTGFPPLATLEEKLFDFRLKARGELSPSPDLTIAAIDEASLEKVGRWPWPRRILADLVAILAGAGADLIVFDILLTEPSPDDPVLAAAMAEAGNVILPVAFLFSKGDGGRSPLFVEPFPASVLHPERLRDHPPIGAHGGIAPVKDLLREEMAHGHINVLSEADGVLRRETAVIEYGGSLHLSLDLVVAAIHLGIPPDRVVLESTRAVWLGPRRFPTDSWGRLLIPYYGPEETFPRFSAADLLGGRFDPSEVRGRIVLVGATAAGLHDTVITPFSSGMAGVEKHAHLISALLEGRSIRPAPLSLNLIFLLTTGIFFSLLLARLTALSGAGAALAGLLALVTGSYFPLAWGGLWIDLTHPSLAILGIFLAMTVHNFAVEERYARRIRSIFSSYVTERVVAELIRRPELARLGGERREITLLFADVRGFTAFSEKHPPEEVVAILNEYLDAMTEIVFRWEGTLDKFIGDAILAFWGAPLPQENHAELALRCALHMEKRIQELQKEWLGRGMAPLDIGIGVNTGEVLVGNIGAEGKKMDYTVIGDAVNIGARVEALTRNFECRILITEFTLEKIRGALQTGRLAHVAVVKSLDRVPVKGRTAPVALFQVEGIEHGTPSRLPEEVLEPVSGDSAKS